MSIGVMAAGDAILQAWQQVYFLPVGKPFSTGTNILWNGGSEAKSVTFAPSSGKLEGPPKFNH